LDWYRRRQCKIDPKELDDAVIKKIAAAAQGSPQKAIREGNKRIKASVEG